MARMKRKQRSNDGAGPNGTGEALQNQEQEHSIGNVQNQADKVMGARVLIEQTAIDHVRNPGQRMPIAGEPGGERPRNVLQI